MTDGGMALIDLVEKQADGDLVREMLACAAERIMEVEVEAPTGAAKGARSPVRVVQRNGYRDRDWVEEAQEGSLLPERPRTLADGGESPGCVRHCLSDQWRSNGSLQEACVHGVSTRSVDDLLKAMG